MKGRMKFLSKKKKNASLLQCAQAGDCETAKRLIEKGADPNALDKRIQWSTFRTAIYYEQTEFFKFLLGISDFTNKSGCLLAAVASRNAECISLLLKHDSPVDERNHLGFTPLHISVSLNSDVICQMLLEAGADVDAQNHKGLTPAHLAASRRENKCLELILQKGPNLNIVDTVLGHGFTPLGLAVSVLNTKAVSLILKGNVDLDMRDASGSTVLHRIASQMENTATIHIASLLVEQNADVNVQDENGATPLMLAAMNSCKELAVLLIRHGASVTLSNKFHETALDLSSNPSITSLLKHTERNEGQSVFREGLSVLSRMKASILLGENLSKEDRMEGERLICGLESWLRKNVQKDVVDGIMTPAQKQKLKENRLLLVDEISPPMLFDHFIQNGIFNDDIVEEIRLQGTRRRMAERTLDMITRRGRKAFAVLCEALRDTGQDYLVEMLRTGEEASG